MFSFLLHCRRKSKRSRRALAWYSNLQIQRGTCTDFSSNTGAYFIQLSKDETQYDDGDEECMKAEAYGDPVDRCVQ